jgi:gliding motility-associated-like protein
VVYTLNNCLSIPVQGTVTVKPMPMVTVNSGQICSGQNFNLQANGTPLGGTYTWTGNTSTTSQITVSPTSTTSYSVQYSLDGCVSSSATGVVDIIPAPTASFTASATQGCSPLTVTFTNTSTSVGDITGCLWSFGNTTSSGCGSMSQTFTQPGCYNIALSVTSNGCTSVVSNPNMICVQSDPVASFMTSPNTFTQTSQEMSFINTSSNATIFEWDFGNGNTSNDFSPSHFYTNTAGGQTVTLTATTTFGCTAQTSVFIPFTEAELYYVPNAFTPDGDGFNQVFTPVFTSGFDPYNFEMIIFNRWGEIVFVTHDAKRGWDGSYGEFGRDVQAGLYTYKITYKNPQKDERKVISGHVNLLR